MTSYNLNSITDSKAGFLRSCWFTVALNLLSVLVIISCWWWESTTAALGTDRRHTLCVSTGRYTGPPEAAEPVVRLRSHPITTDPCWLTHKPMTKTHSIVTTHRHTSQTVHFNANKCSPLLWEENLADCIFSSLSYGGSRLYSELSGGTKQSWVHIAHCLHELIYWVF